MIDQEGCQGGGEMSDSEYMLKAESNGFADR